jgi:hypothetical protein
VDRNALEQLLHSYNFWMGVSTIAVAVGILGEYVAHFIFEEEARHNKREMTVSILMGALVLGGVVGEYIFGEKLSQVANQLQRLADTEIAASNKRAEEAHLDAEMARKEADSFELQIALAQKNAAGASERAAVAENDTARLKQRLADRQLTDEQVQSVASQLKPFAGQVFAITPYWNVKESLAIANRIYLALHIAGWSDLKMGGVLVGGVEGVLVYVSPQADQRTRKAADTLVAALNAENVEAVLRVEETSAGHNALYLNVGSKPGTP